MSLESEDTTQSDAMSLCKSCGLCCTGHLFEWSKLKSTELTTAAALGLKVLGSEPNQRGFNQPCPAWNGVCTVYASPHYPHFCRLYKCSLLKKLMDERVSLEEALDVVEQTKERIAELESLMIGSGDPSFRKRLLVELERRNPNVEFQEKARDLLLVYRHQFGVKDLIDDFE